MARSRDYDYRPPSYEDTVKRAENQGSMFDNMLKDAKFFKPKQGQNLIRILPPGWPKAVHYGLTVMSHSYVGPSDRRYLCLKENPTSPYKRCPICEELYNLGPKATQEDRMNFRPRASVLYYVIDRDSEKDGPQVWTASARTDSEIAAQSINARSKSVIDIVDPENGYDLQFVRTGQGRNNTRYRGFQVVREPSPLADSARDEDDWLDYVYDKPLPSLLQFYPPEHIEEVFYGRASKEDEPRSRSRDRDDEPDDRSQPRRTRAEDEPRERTRRDRDGDSDRLSRDDERDDGNERRTRRARTGGAEDRDDELDEGAAADRRHRRSERSGDGGGTEREAAQVRRRSGDRDEDRAPASEREVRSGRRSQLAEDLDDEIPSEAGRRGRPNGRDGRGDDRRMGSLDEEVAESTEADRRGRLRSRINRE